MQGLKIAKRLLLSMILLASPLALADSGDMSKDGTPSSIGLFGGLSSLSQGLGTQLQIAAHGDYRFSKSFAVGLLFNYVSLNNSIPGMPGVQPLVNGSFYVMAFEFNYFFPGILNGLYLGPAFGFSTYNSPATPTQGSYNSVYWAYGAHVGYDIPIGNGFTVGALVNDIMIVSSSDLGTNTNELNFGALMKFWF